MEVQEREMSGKRLLPDLEGNCSSPSFFDLYQIRKSILILEDEGGSLEEGMGT